MCFAKKQLVVSTKFKKHDIQIGSIPPSKGEIYKIFETTNYLGNGHPTFKIFETTNYLGNGHPTFNIYILFIYISCIYNIICINILYIL